MPFNRAHFEAVGSDTATLDGIESHLISLKVDWTKLAALIQAVLAFLGVSLPASPTVAQMNAAATAAGINWGKLLQIILALLPGLLSGLGGATNP